MNKYFKVIAKTYYVSSWKSRGLSAETIKPPTTSDNSLTPALSYYGPKMRVKFYRSLKMFTREYNFKINKITRSFIIY